MKDYVLILKQWRRVDVIVILNVLYSTTAVMISFRFALKTV